MKPLAEVVRALRGAGELVAPSPQSMPHITDVVDDSRRVTPGSLFCAIEGTQEDGHRYVPDAVAKGAAALLVTRRLDVSVPQITVRDSRRSASVAARIWFGDPAAAMRVIAVTGTNGKSTTTALIRHVLNPEGGVAAIGTLGVVDGNGNAVTEQSLLTTPGPVELYGRLARLKRSGVHTVVMEASSHGIAQGRLEGLVLTEAVYTNLTQDHLDYHADLDAYRAAKLRLSSYLEPAGLEIVLAEEAAWAHLPERPTGRRVYYGRAPTADVRGVREQCTAAGSECVMQIGSVSYPVMLPLIGEFNVTNALAAAAAAWGLGVSPDVIVERLASAPQVPGRVERLVSGPFTIVRDYAHTPDALKRVIAAMRMVTAGRLVVLFGAGGDRDRRKRPIMGRYAAEGADVVFLTSDNPRTEDPDRILDDIQAGMDGCEPVRIEDRREAIHRAVETLEEGDCLLLAGKGHETYQVVGTERRPMDEAEIVEQAVRERGS